MKRSRILLVLTIVLVFCSISASAVFADSNSNIGIELDKTEAKVGDIIKASVKVNNIKNFNGFQVNIRYNQEVLQAVSQDSSVEFTDSSCPTNGDIIENKDYSLFPVAANNLAAGILNFGRSYVDLASYRKSNKPESTGTIAVLYFKVIKDAATEIVFEELGTMPNSINGTLLFDWDGNTLSDYQVNNSQKINPNSSPAPMPKYTMKGINMPSNTATKNNNTFIVILVAVIAVVVILLFVFIITGKNKKSNYAENEFIENDDDNEYEDSEEETDDNSDIKEDKPDDNE
ncbi:MAG: cohesin domain-containing protein [Bacillota bacterium]|nr:cohesin domain-containing protein [Bacillota bacterium]